MQWNNLLSNSRFSVEDTQRDAPAYRNDFNKDQDRILFAKSFRRLGRKTQVHPMPTLDHIHNRLSHSLEVGCVARSLAAQIGDNIEEQLPENITPADMGLIAQNAALVHDIGNPPFGHAGEKAISDWFKSLNASRFFDGLSDWEILDLQNFEGNAQGLRVITKMEYYGEEGGMRLTYATLGAMIKYPHSVKNITKNKFGAFASEMPTLEKIATHLGLVEKNTQIWSRHPLAYLVESADDICYALLDVEDALDMNLLRWSDVQDIFGVLTDKSSQHLQSQNITLLRAKAMDSAIREVVHTFLNNQPALLNGEFNQPLLDAEPNEIKNVIKQAKKLVAKKVFRSQDKSLIEIGAYEVLSVLLENFITSVFNFYTDTNLTFKDERLLSLLENYAPKKEASLYENYRKVLDFISNMSDQAAIRLAEQLRGNMNSFLIN